MDSIKHLVYKYLIDQGITDALAKNLNILPLALGLLCIVLIVNFIVRKLLIVVFTQLSKRSKTHFDDLLIANKAPRNVARIVPLLISLQFVPLVFVDFPALKDFFNLVLKVFVIVFSLWIV